MRHDVYTQPLIANATTNKTRIERVEVELQFPISVIFDACRHECSSFLSFISFSFSFSFLYSHTLYLMQSEPYEGVYRATYSGVPVYEILIQGHPIMRRQSDSYMNATQILKVAGIEKGRRTKILEREILIGEHEKIQGGYGKYQGTW